jgi:SWI/SNF-related matrix-associated actin-dependent regulator of chromatin subfamily A-like protein 1
MILYNYQVPAVDFCLENKRVLLNIPAGAGKTIIAGEVLNRAGLYPVLIVTPNSVKQQFADELETHFGITETHIISSKDKIIPTDKKIYIVNPDILKKMFEQIILLGVKAVVGDESHLFKTHDVGRTKTMFRLCLESEIVILMSGTPMPLGVIDLYSQFSILRPTVFGPRDKKNYPNRVFDWYGFALRYCEGHQGRFGFEYKGISNMEELLGRSQNIMFTLREEDVLKDLPPVQIIDIPLAMNDKEKAGYDLVNKDFENYLRSVGKTEYEVYKSMTNEALVKLNELRKYTSGIKLKHIKELVENLGEKTIVFFAYTASVQYFKETFGDKARTLIGSDNTTTRTANIEAFKNDPNVRYLLVNVKAGGTGLNLQNARMVVFAELPWSWADFRQAYARAWRRGQGRRVLVYKPMVKGTVDEKINKIIYDKKQCADLINNNT